MPGRGALRLVPYPMLDGDGSLEVKTLH